MVDLTSVVVECSLVEEALVLVGSAVVVSEVGAAVLDSAALVADEALETALPLPW